MVVTQTGISSTVDGVKDFFGQLGSSIGGGLIDYTKAKINAEVARNFPEKVPPQDFVNGSTGSPSDNALREAANTQESQSRDKYIKYGVYGLAAVAALGTIIYLARK